MSDKTNKSSHGTVGSHTVAEVAGHVIGHAVAGTAGSLGGSILFSPQSLGVGSDRSAELRREMESKMASDAIDRHIERGPLQSAIRKYR